MTDNNNQFPWSKQPGEPTKWYKIFEMFRLYGPDRSLLAVYNEVQKKKFERSKNKSPDKFREMEWKPKKRASETWVDQSKAWDWRERADAWDTATSAAAKEQLEREVIEDLNTGLALPHKRVNYLKDLTERIWNDLNDPRNIWLVDTKEIESKSGSLIIESSRKFNYSLIAQFRGLLDDIALEKSERIKNMDIKTAGNSFNTGKVIIYIPDNGREDTITEDVPEIIEIVEKING
jgi:hypothetical protein